MPKLIKARAPEDAREEWRIRRLARSRLGPRDCILRARMVALSWDGRRVPDIAAELDCHPKTVRARLARFDAAGVDGLRDRTRPGRHRRITEAERSRVIRLVATDPVGCGNSVCAPLKPVKRPGSPSGKMASLLLGRGVSCGRVAGRNRATERGGRDGTAVCLAG